MLCKFLGRGEPNADNRNEKDRVENRLLANISPMAYRVVTRGH